MFTPRELSEPVATVRETHAPGARVFDCARNFETLPPAQAEELALVIDEFRPHDYAPAWLPSDAPGALASYVGPELTIGMPGDGSVVWTRQTEPPVVLCKPRLAESPDGFADFLLAEAFVQVGLDEPEHFLGFFGDSYPDCVKAVSGRLDPAETYQLAAACYDAYLG